MVHTYHQGDIAWRSGRVVGAHLAWMITYVLCVMLNPGAPILLVTIQ
jgi:hypothetical protein